MRKRARSGPRWAIRHRVRPIGRGAMGHRQAALSDHRSDMFRFAWCVPGLVHRSVLSSRASRAYGGDGRSSVLLGHSMGTAMLQCNMKSGEDGAAVRGAWPSRNRQRSGSAPAETQRRPRTVAALRRRHASFLRAAQQRHPSFGRRASTASCGHHPHHPVSANLTPQVGEAKRCRLSPGLQQRLTVPCLLVARGHCWRPLGPEGGAVCGGAQTRIDGLLHRYAALASPSRRAPVRTSACSTRPALPARRKWVPAFSERGSVPPGETPPLNSQANANRR
jgi:hypothetical protein